MCGSSSPRKRKLKIGMLYATQEVSGVAHQVKANGELGCGAPQ